MNQARKQVEYLIALAKSGEDCTQQQEKIIHQMDFQRSTSIPSASTQNEARADWLLERYQNAWHKAWGAGEDDGPELYQQYLDVKKRLIALMAAGLATEDAHD